MVERDGEPHIPLTDCFFERVARQSATPESPTDSAEYPAEDWVIAHAAAWPSFHRRTVDTGRRAAASVHRGVKFAFLRVVRWFPVPNGR
jgi:hypothetical protein